MHPPFLPSFASLHNSGGVAPSVFLRHRWLVAAPSVKVFSCLCVLLETFGSTASYLYPLSQILKKELAVVCFAIVVAF